MKNIEHTMKSRLYRIWILMRERCNNINTPPYKDYGGRGIKVCDEWNDYENFYAWAMENNYSDDLTIDRIDTNGNYCPDNCRWATRKEQQNNRRNNRLIAFDGKTQTVAQWAEEYNIDNAVLFNRLNYGWDIEKALTTQTYNKSQTAFGKTQNISQWAKEYNIAYITLIKRLEYGWTIEEALTKPVRAKKKNPLL